MLVLSRRVGQQIRIGKSVVVTLLKVARNKARIGVYAPRGIPVYRQELLDFDRRRPTAPPDAPSPMGSNAIQGVPKPLRPAVCRFATARPLWDNVAV